MVCVEQRKYVEFADKLGTLTIRRRLPYMGSLELTYRCNQNCCHCYCNIGANDQRQSQELTLKQIKAVLDQLSDLGCLWLLLTGGEVLIRPDFWDIYEYAVSKGMMVEVFTNATLIDEETARRFSQMLPLGLEISIYGSCAKVHESITRVEGSFSRMIKGIELLHKYDVPMFFKTVLMDLNYADLDNMGKLASSFGGKFKFDPLVCPRKDGGKGPLAHRLPVTDAMAVELKDPDAAKTYREIIAELKAKGFTDILYCLAGINSFNIDPYGNLSPCTMMTGFQYSVTKNSVAKAWGQLVTDFAQGINKFLSADCKTCDMITMCGNCPAWSYLETGRLDGKPEYLCDHSARLKEMVLNQGGGL